MSVIGVEGHNTTTRGHREVNPVTHKRFNTNGTVAGFLIISTSDYHIVRYKKWHPR